MLFNVPEIEIQAIEAKVTSAFGNWGWFLFNVGLKNDIGPDVICFVTCGENTHLWRHT